MMKLLKAFGRNNKAAAAAEYALILAVVAGGIAVAATALGTKITGVITAVTADIPAA